ncbi:hypothetical protein [Liquorilactobacillus uvarum]|nr:hypothetical protein [Liquorilactobacillus uvarum]
MKMFHKLGLIGIIAGTSVAVYCSHRQLERKGKQAKVKYMSLKDDLHKIIEKTSSVSNNFQNLSHDIDKYSPVFEELMDEISEFQFLIKPHLDKIEKAQSK